MDKQGLLLCARYSIAPNFLGYCGPDKNQSLIDHLQEDMADKEVSSILLQFETLYPYLKFIATENNISNPFAKKVVEAYWLGNKLLQNAANIDYVDLIDEKLHLEKRMGRKKIIAVKRKITQYRFYPHHSFHVFNIFKRTGHNSSDHTLETMDNCRIGYGKIIQTAKIKNLIVETNPLVIKDGKLQLGKPILKKLKIDYRGKTFFKDYKLGDWVSFHWGFVCDILNDGQLRNLDFYTKQAINFFNKK